MSGDETIEPGRAWPVVDLSEPKTDLAGVERRVSALERHLFDPCETADPSETEENADKPPSAPEALELAKGSIAGPGYIYGDRADRANALLGTVETILATGGAVETHGVRIEPCDEYGGTATTRDLDHARRYADRLEERAERFRRQRDAARRDVETLIRERDAALAGAESAEKDLERAEALFSAIKLPADAEPTDEEIGRGAIICGAKTVRAGSWRECELIDGHTGPHYSRHRLSATW